VPEIVEEPWVGYYVVGFVGGLGGVGAGGADVPPWGRDGGVSVLEDWVAGCVVEGEFVVGWISVGCRGRRSGVRRWGSGREGD